LLADFLAHRPEPIGTPQVLAERMARLTHLIRDVIIVAFEKEVVSDLLTDWRRAFAEVLIAELDQPGHVEQFADMFAQTLAYGLFSARIRHAGGNFTRQKAQYLIPRTNPFLRDFFTYITGVPREVWQFEVGGYQVLHKWLKDRKGRVLSYDELEHYQKIVVALQETIRLMDEIEAAIPHRRCLAPVDWLAIELVYGLSRRQ